jgi:hypothetical protein
MRSSVPKRTDRANEDPQYLTNQRFSCDPLQGGALSLSHSALK